RDLCREIDEAPELARVLWGLYAFYLLRAEMQTAGELAEQLLGLAERADDTAIMLAARRAMGTTRFFLGDFTAARHHLDAGIEFYEPGQHRNVAFTYGQDFGVTCRDFSAHVLWYLGYADQARTRIREALTLARETGHVFSINHAMDFNAWLHECCQQPRL